MAKWFGEVKEWTDNEKTFMVKAAASCRARQEEGQCKWGSKECNECKWQAPMAAIKELDSFTQSRIEDKADMLDMQSKLFESMCDKTDYERRYNGLKLAFCFIIMVAITAIAACLINAQPYEASYNSQSFIDKVKQQLRDDGPKEWFYDGHIDCKDWAVTFMDLWYKAGAPDGTCILVHNIGGRMNHLMVAVWHGKRAVVLEPQACWRFSMSPVAYWGDDYDSKWNRLYETWPYLAHADRDARHLMRLSCSTEQEYYANLNGRKRPWEE